MRRLPRPVEWLGEQWRDQVGKPLVRLIEWLGWLPTVERWVDRLEKRLERRRR